MNSQHWFNIVLLSRKYCNHLSEEEKAKKKTPESTRYSCLKSTWTYLMEKEYPSSYSPTYVSYLSSISLNDPPKKTCLATEELWQSKWRKASFFTLQVDIRIMNRCHAETTRRHTCTNYRTQQIRFLCPSISNTNDKHFTLGTKWRGGEKNKPLSLGSWIISPPPLIRHRNNTDKHRHTLGHNFVLQAVWAVWDAPAGKQTPASRTCTKWLCCSPLKLHHGQHVFCSAVVFIILSFSVTSVQ